jgi:hypothetical protein
MSDTKTGIRSNLAGILGLGNSPADLASALENSDEDYVFK